MLLCSLILSHFQYWLLHCDKFFFQNFHDTLFVPKTLMPILFETVHSTKTNTDFDTSCKKFHPANVFPAENWQFFVEARPENPTRSI